MLLEIELKLRLSPDKIVRLRRNSLLKSLTISPPATLNLYTVYYDTPDFDLWRSNVAFRLRRSGKRWVQSIKGSGDVAAGLHQRHEWEAPLLKAQPDFAKIVDPSLAKLFDNADLREQLRPLFITEFKRNVRMLRFADKSEAEFSLDQGKIYSTDGSSRSICEIELELKSGSPLSLYHLALDLLFTIPFRLENASKAERGFALVSGFKPLPVKAKPIRLDTAMTVSEAFKAVAGNCLSHLHANEAGILESRDPEYLHQMRVALRRIRLAVAIFAKAFAGSPFTPVTKELKWLSGQLGPARDWDVFISGILKNVSGNFPEHSGMLILERKCEQVREEYNDRAREAVESERYTALMLKLGAWLSAQPSLIQAKHSQEGLEEIQFEMPVKEFAGALLSRQQTKLKKYGRKLRKLDATELHALRIATKKQRYVSEFFAKLYAAKKTKRYIKALAELQETLGAVNDAAVAGRLLNEIPTKETNSREHEAIGMVRGWAANMALIKKPELDKLWADFEKNEHLWRNARPRKSLDRRGS